MKHIQTLNTKSLQNTVKKGGCGECQTSCQSACKTSCTVGNQSCESNINNNRTYKKQRASSLLVLYSIRMRKLEYTRKGGTYRIDYHQYKSNGFNIVMDVNSGSVHIVDDVVYDVLPYLEKKELKEEILKALANSYAPAEIEEALEECHELEEAGALFTEDIYENAIDAFKNRPTVVKALCLHIAHDCNLACRYCFAEEGEYHGRRALMSYEVGKKALDFLIANSGSRRNLEVDFFGGEPLMNWQVVKDLVAYGREQEKIHNKNFRFTLTTNGVLLNDEVMEFCNREMANVVLSIDGRKEVHDYMRPFRKGKGSYDLILPKFEKLAESRHQDKYYVRGTFTRTTWIFQRCPASGRSRLQTDLRGAGCCISRKKSTHCGRKIFRQSAKNMTRLATGDDQAS